MKLGILGLSLAVITTAVTGCVGTQVTKKISVHKDASGKITGYTEEEWATQAGGSTRQFEFEHLKNTSTDTQPIKVN